MLMWLKSVFGRTRTARTEEELHAATADSLRRMLPSCPTCLRSLTGHSYTQYAIAAGKEDMTELLAASLEQRWTNLCKIQSFDGSQNALAAFAMRCTDRSGTLLVTLDPEELYERPALLRRYPLGSEEWARLLESAPDLKWHSF